MTGLSPRVIRVWFQNKRCKDKKKTIQMKLQMQQEKVIDDGSFSSNIAFNGLLNLNQEGRKMGYGGMPGVPLIASSPVRHDSPLNLHGLEVTSYQPPWKALSDFALHADLDNNGVNHTPAFQHLVNQASHRHFSCLFIPFAARKKKFRCFLPFFPLLLSIHSFHSVLYQAHFFFFIIYLRVSSASSV